MDIPVAEPMIDHGEVVELEILADPDVAEQFERVQVHLSAIEQTAGLERELDEVQGALDTDAISSERSQTHGQLIEGLSTKYDEAFQAIGAALFQTDFKTGSHEVSQAMTDFRTLFTRESAQNDNESTALPERVNGNAIYDALNPGTVPSLHKDARVAKFFHEDTRYSLGDMRGAVEFLGAAKDDMLTRGETEFLAGLAFFRLGSMLRQPAVMERISQDSFLVDYFNAHTPQEAALKLVSEVSRDYTNDGQVNESLDKACVKLGAILAQDGPRFRRQRRALELAQDVRTLAAIPTAASRYYGLQEGALEGGAEYVKIATKRLQAQQAHGGLVALDAFIKQVGRKVEANPSPAIMLEALAVDEQKFAALRTIRAAVLSTREHRLPGHKDTATLLDKLSNYSLKSQLLGIGNRLPKSEAELTEQLEEFLTLQAKYEFRGKQLREFDKGWAVTNILREGYFDPGTGNKFSPIDSESAKSLAAFLHILARPFNPSDHDAPAKNWDQLFRDCQRELELFADLDTRPGHNGRHTTVNDNMNWVLNHGDVLSQIGNHNLPTHVKAMLRDLLHYVDQLRAGFEEPIASDDLLDMIDEEQSAVPEATDELAGIDEDLLEELTRPDPVEEPEVEEPAPEDPPEPEPQEAPDYESDIPDLEDEPESIPPINPIPERLFGVARSLDFEVYPPEAGSRELREHFERDFGDDPDMEAVEWERLDILVEIRDFIRENSSNVQVELARSKPGSFTERLPYYVLEVVWEDQTVIIADNPKYGNGTYVFKDADMPEPWIDMLKYGRQWTRLFGGRMLKHPVGGFENNEANYVKHRDRTLNEAVMLLTTRD